MWRLVRLFICVCACFGGDFIVNHFDATASRLYRGPRTMADMVDCASRTPTNREIEMTYLPLNSIQERCTGTESAANLPPFDPLRS